MHANSSSNEQLCSLLSSMKIIRELTNYLRLILFTLKEWVVFECICAHVCWKRGIYVT